MHAYMDAHDTETSSLLPERFCNNLYSYQFLRTFLVALTSGDENPIHLYSLFHPKISHLNPQNLSPQPKPTQAGHLHRTKGTLTQPPSSDAIMLSHIRPKRVGNTALRCIIGGVLEDRLPVLRLLPAQRGGCCTLPWRCDAHCQNCLESTTSNLPLHSIQLPLDVYSCHP